METLQLLRLLSGKDIRLWREGNALRYDAPAGAITPELRETILAQKDKLLTLLGETASPASTVASCSLTKRIEANAERFPELIAVSFGSVSLTYAQLNAQANCLAHRLRSLGVTADSRVMVLLPKSPEAIVTLLAILKAGAGYVPLDPTYPPQRLTAILEDAAPSLLITLSSETVPVPAHVLTLLLDVERQSLLQESTENLPEVGDQNSLAYVIYTSGSTGKPKGVEMPRRPLHNLLEWVYISQNGEVAQGMKTLQFPSLAFDVHFQDIFSTLWSAGTLLLTDEATRRDPTALLELIVRERVERIYLPVVMLQQIAEVFNKAKHGNAKLKRIHCAGEALVITERVRAMFRALPHCRLFNEYGPSETHVVTAFSLPANSDLWEERPSIGTPLPNVTIAILDEEGKLAPPRTPGELLIGGAAPARGYLGDPAKTAERFITRDGERFYRTGDLVKWNPDNTLCFLGRADEQVKIRGFRVEPGEIEMALRAFPGIVATVVIAKEYGTGDRRLIAYYVPESSATVLREGELREFLHEKLPDYMVPAYFVSLERLPVNSSGKVDRNALPGPQIISLKSEEISGFTGTQAAIRKVWSDVLGRQDIGLEDNFFDLGGHSLLIAQVHLQLTKDLKCEITSTDCFQFPTVRSLAAFLTLQDSTETADNSPAPPAQMYHDRARLQRGVAQRAQRSRPIPAVEAENVVSKSSWISTDTRGNKSPR